MNERQKDAIDRCLKELTLALLPNLFLTHLVLNRIFSDAEKQSVQKGGDTDQMVLFTTFQLLKHKEGGWDSLIGYLVDNQYGGQLVNNLMKWGNPDVNDNISDESQRDSQSSAVTRNSVTTVDSTRLAVTQNNLGSLAFRSESAKTDRSAGPETPLTETPIIAADVGLTVSTLSEMLPDVTELMRVQVKDVQVLMNCHRLIDQYPSELLKLLESTLRRSLIAALLSGIKLNSRDSLVIEKFCDLLVKIFDDQGEIELYLEAIDFLLQIVYDDNELVTTAARKSISKLVRTITDKSDVNRRNLIGEKLSVEKICQSIRVQLNKSEYDGTMEISWECLTWICRRSVDNKKKFLDAGGINLFQQCYKNFNSQENLLKYMTWLMLRLSNEESIRQSLMTNENLEFLWEIWGETEDVKIRSRCSRIFTNFLSIPPGNWPLGHPTVEDVKTKLKEEKKCSVM